MSVRETRAMATSTPSDQAAGCALGHHQPGRRSIRKNGDIMRGRCRHCGCELVRTASIRTWYVSALLG
jgi:hypothetical protein